jgi:hypothetical protein
MVRKNNKNTELQIQNPKILSLNRYVKFLIIIAVSMLLMGCWVAKLWEDMSDSSFWQNDEVQITGDGEPTSEVLEPSTPMQNAPLQEPAYQPEEAQGSDESNNDGINTYSVSAQDFNCICQVDGNVNVELRVNGDQLEVIDTNGDVQVYDKIGENSYKRSWMGYYIDTTGGKETKVDEERSVVIILNSNGYTMEHYQGSESSPCCIHTFTKEN